MLYYPHEHLRLEPAARNHPLPLQRREGDVNRLKYINPYPYEFIPNISFVLDDYYISAYQ